MELFHRAPAVADFDCEPVEEFGMRGFFADATEVVGGFDEASSEVVLPDAVDDAAPGQGVVGMNDPIGECDAAVAFGVMFGEIELIQSSDDAGDGIWFDLVEWLSDIAASEDVNVARLAVEVAASDEVAFASMNSADIGEARFGKGGELFGELLDFFAGCFDL